MHPTPTTAAGILVHEEPTPKNSEHPTELSLSAISIGWDKIALQFGKYCRGRGRQQCQTNMQTHCHTGSSIAIGIDHSQLLA